MPVCMTSYLMTQQSKTEADDFEILYVGPAKVFKVNHKKIQWNVMSIIT